jgi:hypothetical protein
VCVCHADRSLHTGFPSVSGLESHLTIGNVPTDHPLSLTPALPPNLSTSVPSNPIQPPRTSTLEAITEPFALRSQAPGSSESRRKTSYRKQATRKLDSRGLPSLPHTHVLIQILYFPINVCPYIPLPCFFIFIPFLHSYRKSLTSLTKHCQTAADRRFPMTS